MSQDQPPIGAGVSPSGAGLGRWGGFICWETRRGKVSVTMSRGHPPCLRRKVTSVRWYRRQWLTPRALT